jgi:TolB-like protein
MGAVRVRIVLCACTAAVVSAPCAIAADNQTVAVLPFRNSSAQADLDAVAEGLPDLIIACAQKSSGVTFVERTALKKLLTEQKISRAGLTEEKTQVQVGQLLGAKHVVTGGMTVLDGRLKINAHLIEVETSRVVKSSEASGALGELMETVQPVAADLMKGIGIELKPLSAAEIDRSPEANLHFMRGLGYYYGNLRNQAIAEFMKTLSLDPSQGRARWWNAACYYDLKEWDHAALEYERFLKDFPTAENAAEAARRLKQCKEEK